MGSEHRLPKNSVAKLFKEPAIWPLIPPWWLIPTTDAAALLNVKSTTLHTWRIRSYGPPVYPPMYLRPTQGNPLYYQFGALRSWAASKLGLHYSFEDQCYDFFAETAPVLTSGTGPLQSRIDVFDGLFLEDRKRVLTGTKQTMIRVEHIHALDVFFARQPGSKGKPRVA